MRAFLTVSTVSCLLLLAGCEQDSPTQPTDPVADPPALTRNFEIEPVRSPGGSSELTVSFAVPVDLVVTRTRLLVDASGATLLPSPWAGIYRINGELLSEGRKAEDPGTWTLRLRFRNQSNIVCSSCDPVIARYELYD